MYLYNIMSTEPTTTITGTKLLDLTPVCLQNTNNIMNTLIFMCLDQGHDFRDKSSRTLTGGIRGWVDIDYRGIGYLNKISEEDLSTYIPDESDNNFIESDKIFGKQQFVTGLINTTFKGGNGTYGLVIVDDEYYNKISSKSATTSTSESDVKDNIVSNFIVDKLRQRIQSENESDSITFYFGTSDNNYYILSKGDDTSSEGITISDNLAKEDGSSLEGTTVSDNRHDKMVSFLFLPLYKRAYNKGMHKLWDFNTKKHIFVVNLDKMYIKRKNNPLDFTVDSRKTEISCKKLTTIDLIIPTYTIVDFQKKFLDNISRYLKKQAVFNVLDEKNLLGSAKINQLFDNPDVTEEQKEVILKYFLNLLFQGGDNVSTDDSDGPPSIQYTINESDGVGYFTLKNYDDVNLYKCVPRGAKYWFDSNHTSAFKHFVKLLYACQKPFIHPKYNISNATGDLERSKEYILTTLLDPLQDASPEELRTNLEKYIAYKNNSKKFDEKSPFILKQYGVIPDTTIGTDNKGQNSTINHLINSLNNVPNNTTCAPTNMVGGDPGDLNKLEELFPMLSDEISLIESSNTYTTISGTIKKLYPTISGDATAKKILIDYLKKTFGDELIDNEISKLDKKLLAKSDETPKAEPKTKPQAVLSLSPLSGVTTAASETVSIPTVQADDKPISQVYFDNIKNVNRDFNLGLSADKINGESFIKISSETPNKNIELYETEYANSLQQYYDFIPQAKSSSGKKNYFNNCWQTIDFFQENSPERGQTGGEDRYQYPYRFTVTSAQIDGSLQGGQSIPQYHPPEVDIYMPIFELEGDGNLKGIIARMVFVKEILANAINSKSRTVVFCHFAYVDFESTGVSPPNNISEYPTALKELLKYTIDNTYYVNTNDDCINLDALNENPDINADDQIDFKIELRNPETSSSIGVRKWYKYYTYTSGPGVKEHFVPPTNYDSILDILHFSKDVAKKIASVGDKLIKNSGKLRIAFGAPEDSSVSTDIIDAHPGAVLFVKLFLIRNKYTGDKSRATDTLFLNQTKYLEGIQISNDENTLFNALMFGQNTIWSTPSKTVFNMAPYLTKPVLTDEGKTDGGKMPINGGFYIDTLCESLRGNPSIKIEAIQTEEAVSDDALVRMDYKISIVNKISELYKNCELERKKFYIDFEFSLINALISYNKFQEKYNDLSKYYNNYDKNLDKLLISMDNIIQQQNIDSGKKIISEWNEGSGFIEQGTIDNDSTTGVGSSIIITTGKALKALDDTNKEINTFLNLLINFVNQIKQCADFSNNHLNNLILYITQNIPWWNVLEYKNIIVDRYCYMCSAFLCKAVEKCEKDNCYQKVGNYFNERKNDMIRKVSSDKDIINKVNACFSKFVFTIPTQSTKKAIMTTKPETGVCPPIKPDETGKLRLEVSGDSSKEEIFQNEEKLKSLTPDIINVLLSDDTKLSTVNQKLSAIDANVNKVLGRAPIAFSFIQPTARLGATERGMRGGMNSNIDATDLNLFYENTYRCNVGNYLKHFIKIMTSINKQYVDSNINKSDIVKDIIVKILLKDINLINSSYVPLLNTDEIVDTINNIDETYTVEQMNTVKNLYSSQLEIYSLINTVMNIDYEDVNERQYLVDLINENINENRYNDLNLPFIRSELLNAILTNDTSTLFSEIQDLNEDVEMTYEKTDEVAERKSIKRVRDTESAENDSIENITKQAKKEHPTNEPIPNPWLSNKASTTSQIDFSSIFNQYGINNVKNKKRLRDLSNETNELNNFKVSRLIPVAGSIKNKRKQINKTRNSKRQNKKRTIKKKNVKVRRYTRRR